MVKQASKDYISFVYEILEKKLKKILKIKRYVFIKNIPLFFIG